MINCQMYCADDNCGRSSEETQCEHANEPFLVPTSSSLACLLSLFITLVLKHVVPGPSSISLLEMQMLGSHPRPAELGAQGRKSKDCFNKHSR